MKRCCMWMVAAILMSVAVGGPALAAGYQPIKVEPSRFVFEGKPGEQITGSIVVRNTGQEPATPQALLSDWTLDEGNRLVVLEAGSLDSSLEGWIKFNPRRFQMQPNAAQTVRFTVKIPHDAQPGERRGMIAFEQIIPYDEGGVGATARVQVTSTIYVAVLPIERHIDIIGLHIQPNEDTQTSTLVLQVKGTGTGHYRGVGRFQILPDSDETPLASGDLEPLVVMPGVASRFGGSVEYVLEPGRYRLAVEIISEEAGSLPLHRIYAFEVPTTEV
jgi:hypothetical protein